MIKTPVHIRWLIRRDMPEVLDIEQASFEFAWVEEDFLEVLRNRACIGMVAETPARVLGFMVYELRKSSLRLLNFAVHPDWRRQDIGTQMVDKLKSKLSVHRRRRITLEVRETNLAAQLFFKRQAFRCTRVLPNFYEDSGEDALVMRHTLEVTEEEAAAVNWIAQFLE